MSDFARYSRVPSAETFKRDSAVVISATDMIGTCCVVEAIRWSPNIFGDRTLCFSCKNVLKAVEDETDILKSEIDLGTEKLKFDLAPGYKCLLVAYDSSKWESMRSELDIEKAGLRVSGHQSLHDLEVFVQNPSSWFYPDSIRVVKVKHGCAVAIGKMQEPFEKQVASDEDLQIASREGLSITKV